MISGSVAAMDTENELNEPTEPVGGPSDPASPPPGVAGGDEPLGESGMKALRAERANRAALEAKLKELAPLAEEASKAREAQKTEHEKLTEQLVAANAASAAMQLKSDRLNAALAKAPTGLPHSQVVDLAARLQGETSEELEADAETLFAQFSGVAPGKQRAAAGNLRGGNAPDGDGSSTIEEQIVAAEADKNFDLARRLKSQLVMQSLTK